jgi:hypothetical protein
MGLFDDMKRSFREGRDAAIEARKEEARVERERCRAQGRRYPGCPLDLIEAERLPAPGRRIGPPARRLR